jgi:hypothetical protein
MQARICSPPGVALTSSRKVVIPTFMLPES